MNAEYPFLILEIAHSEADKHALRKAKDYIRYSQGKIIYVIVVSVYHSNNHKPKQLGSGLLKSFLPQNPGNRPLHSHCHRWKVPRPTAPSELDKRYGVTPASNVDAKADAPSIDSSPIFRRLTASDSVGQSLFQG